MKNQPQFLAVLLVLLTSSLFAQQTDKLNLFDKPATLNKTRFWALNTGIATSFTGTVVALNQLWYKEHPRSKFHFFNDWAEWKDIDKAGHFYTAYFQSKWTASLFDWTGMPHKKSIWIGAGASAFFQGTLEVMDAFSSEWGFSWGDIGFNTGGALLYVSQEAAWKEQRIVLKYSAHRPNYSDQLLVSRNDATVTTTIEERAHSLFGSSIPEAAIKDYNAITIWASANISSFIKKEDSKFPKWINVSLGYGAENLYNGYGYNWEDEDGNGFTIDPDQFPRYRQFYLSLDIDFTRIPTRSKPLRTLLGALNIIKFPFPTLEINSLGKTRFHPIYF